jgi:integrase/recombinase XerD
VVKPCWARVSGPLEPYAAGLRTELERLGYTPLSAAGHVRLVAHLSRWMAGRDAAVSGVTLAVVDAYFADRRAAGYTGWLTRRSVSWLLDYLRGLEVLAPEPTVVAVTPTARVLQRFREYQLTERGLTASTAELNVRLAAKFLDTRLRADGRLDLRVDAAAVNAFVVSWGGCWPRSVARMVTALRSLLRFLHVDGVLDDPLTVPSTAGWALAGLPKALSGDQVARLLAACDRLTSTGSRDYAVLLLLSRLGLRAGEVAGLELDDIDWRRGEITIRGKANRQDRLPLPADVGAAIVDYLQHARPARALDRTVFVRVQAPYRALTPAGVTTLVSIVGCRCGLGPVHAHRLRHTAASRMLAAGASLPEIGQVLRHRRVSTTAIYAKVDHERLRALARPWPTAVPG